MSYRAVHRKPVTLFTSRAYQTWAAMKQRCLNPRCIQWKEYGGRGITVCSRWLVFDNFLADMGEPGPGMSLDRFPNPNGNYEPGNARWATARQQARNRRNTTLEEHEPPQIRWLVEQGYSQGTVAKFFGINHSMVSRIVAGLAWT